MAKEKAVKLLNWIVYVYILTYILPTGENRSFTYSKNMCLLIHVSRSTIIIESEKNQKYHNRIKA